MKNLSDKTHEKDMVASPADKLVSFYRNYIDTQVLLGEAYQNLINSLDQLPKHELELEA